MPYKIINPDGKSLTEVLYSKTEVIEMLRAIQENCNNTSWYNGDSEIENCISDLE